jgi:NAD(P)-dependent dehydrogenase (short-subunit alcohol dehydrogenase family)
MMLFLAAPAAWRLLLFCHKNKQEVSDMKKSKKVLVAGADRDLYARIKQLFVKAGYEVSAPAVKKGVAREFQENQDVIISAGHDRTGLDIRAVFSKVSEEVMRIPVLAVIPADEYNPNLIFDMPRWGLNGVRGTSGSDEAEKILNTGLEGYFVLFAGYHAVPAHAAGHLLGKSA